MHHFFIAFIAFIAVRFFMTGAAAAGAAFVALEAAGRCNAVVEELPRTTLRCVRFFMTGAAAAGAAFVALEAAGRCNADVGELPRTTLR
jgi:hypothetical protein